MGAKKRDLPSKKSAKGPTDYELKIDAQVEKFIETKQKLTYFLITSSVAVIAFLVAFLEQHWADPRNQVWFALIAAISGLLTACFSVFSLRNELESYRFHLQSRSQGKGYDSLTDSEKEVWDERNTKAARFLKNAFRFLVIEISLSVAYFVLFFA